MSDYYVVPESKLNELKTAIQAKSGGSGSLAFPSGFISEVGNISSGTLNGSFTQAETSLTKTIDIGDSTKTKFLLYATSTPFGNEVRCGVLIFADFTASKSLGIFSNATGASATGKCYFDSLFNGITKSGSVITITSGGGSAEQFNNFINGVTYQWYAW